ncbi:MAG TPA: nitrate ABC transporter ATP-binding protein [Phycisphaerales bacterium]|nr:nitrate ABC transporter ATP-binding protein [Phycisphaerales bacterium]
MTHGKINNLLKEKPIALELRKVGKVFRSDTGPKLRALENVNLRVLQGEFVTLVGATGCGKTTLLNLIAGLDTADEGNLCLGQGLRFGDNIAHVFQHYTLFPWRTVVSNVSFGLQMRSVPRSERQARAAKLLASVGLEGFEDAYPHELSGGMRQRAAIAQALAIEPKLLLMDEPFGAVDDSTRNELQEMLTNLWQENQATILFVTHNIDEAIVLGDRVLVFSERPGRIAREFKIDLPRPRDRMAKEFTDLFIRIRTALSGQLD